jgi:hypothetical protein
LRALSSSTVQPSPTLHHFTLERLKYIESHTDKGVQATQSVLESKDIPIETLEKSTQTLFTRLEQGIQTMDTPGTKVSIMEMDLIDFLEPPIDPLNQTMMDY